MRRPGVRPEPDAPCGGRSRRPPPPVESVRSLSSATPPSSGPTLLALAVLLATPGEEGSSRRQVFSFIQKFPGLHQREIARRLDMSPQAAEHHLRHLVRSGLVGRQEDKGYVRYFVRVQGPDDAGEAIGTQDRQRLAVLRRARPLQIVAHLVHAERMTMGDLARAMRVSAGTLTHHISRLEKAGIVRREVEGRQRFAVLVDRDETVRLLLAHEPPADLVAGFEEIWDEVGF